MATSQSTVKGQTPSYILPPTTTITSNLSNESPASSQIKLICSRRKKGNKRQMYLTFVETRSICPSDEFPCLEILGKPFQAPVLFHDCISLEYFDTIKNNYQSFIYLYFPSYTISIYFSDAHLSTKETIIKQFKSMSESSREQTFSTVEEIFHTFDTKLIPSPPIIPREHALLGPVRLYFTMTDLYIAPLDTSSMDLKTVINNQNPLKDKLVMCIPYFTIKHYGNRARIFLVELGKSKYGDGEIRLKCLSSTLASSIHLLSSPIIEERPWVLSSAFANQFITNKRREKNKHILPPIQFHHDVSHGPIIDLSLPFLEKSTIESASASPPKPRSLVNTFRKFVKHVSPLQRSVTFDVPPSSLSSTRPSVNSVQEQLLFPRTTAINPSITSVEPVILPESYVDMGPTLKKEMPVVIEENDEGKEESKRMIDVGVNTMISISPQVRSVIIVGNSVHLIAEEKEVYPIGQRSFTSPASVLQPFRSQLRDQVTVNNYTMPPDMNTCAPMSSSSFCQPSSTSNSRGNLFVTYDILTFNSAMHPESSAIPSQSKNDFQSDRSEMSLIDQPSSSNSHLFRTLSLSTKNLGDNLSGSILTSHGSIIFFDDRTSNPNSTYLFDTPVNQVNPMNIVDNALTDAAETTVKCLSSRTNIDEKGNSENQRLMSPVGTDQASVMIVSTDIDADPNRTPPFIL